MARVEELESVQDGLDRVLGAVRRGRPDAWIGRGALGNFALVIGGVGAGAIRLDNGGNVVALALDAAGVRALVDRGLTLLGEKPSVPPLPDGLVIQ